MSSDSTRGIHSMVDLSVYCTVTCRQFPNLTFAPRKTCHSQAATSRFNAINVTAKIIIYNSPRKIKHFFARKLRAGDRQGKCPLDEERAHRTERIFPGFAGDSPRAKKALLSELDTATARERRKLCFLSGPRPHPASEESSAF